MFKYFSVILIAVIFSLIVVVRAHFFPGSDQSSTPDVSAPLISQATAGNISVLEVEDYLSKGRHIFIIDVREPFEFEAGHITGAVNLPLGRLEAELDKISRDVDVVLVCRNGLRSQRAWDLLKSKGFDRTWNMLGGMDAWVGKLEKSSL